MSDTLSPDFAPVSILSEQVGEPGKFDSDVRTYGSFWVGNDEFALLATDIQEVVPFPDAFVRVPAAPPYLLGLFDLRGTVVPVVCVAQLLGMEPPERGPDTRIAILDCGDSRIGAVFSKTGELLRVAPAEHRKMRHHEGEADPIVGSLLRLDDGKRIVQVITAELVAQVKRIPRGRSNSEATIEDVPKTRLVIAGVGGVDVAFESSQVIEIQEGLEVSHTVPHFEHHGGVVNLRGEVVAILRLASVFGNSEVTQAPLHIFVHDNNTVVALEVETIRDVVEIPDRDIRHVDMLTRLPAGAFCSQVVHLPNSQHALHVDVARLFEFVGVEDVPDNPDALSRIRPESGDVKGTDDRTSFVAFGLGAQLFGFPLEFVREIQDFPAEHLRPPGQTAEMLGMMNLRGEVITLIDLRTRCGFDDGPEREIETTKILVVENHAIGYVVDDLRGIVHAPGTAMLDIARPFGDNTGSPASKFLGNVIAVPGEPTFMALDPLKLLACDVTAPDTQSENHALGF